MDLEQKLGKKSNQRYHSEECFQGMARMKLRGGAYSNTGKYLSKVKHFKSLAVNEEDIVLSKVNLKGSNQSLLSLPKINAKLIQSSAVPTTRGMVKRALFKGRQTHNMKGKDPKSSIMRLQAPISDDRLFDYAYMTHQGTRIKNEDRIAIHIIQAKGRRFQYLSVFDGHGGHLASSYLASQFHLILKEQLEVSQQPKLALFNSVKIVQQRFKKNARLAHKSGSCAVIALLQTDNCWVANIGDSRMISINKKGEVQQVTKDHKPQQQTERKRIQYHGGQVYRQRYQDPVLSQLSPTPKKLPFRVYPSKLSVSRTIADIHLKKENESIIICQPDIYYLKTSNLSHVLLFSDGVYEKMGNRQIGEFFLQNNLNKGVSKLFKWLNKMGGQDNRSLVAVNFKGVGVECSKM